MRNLNLENLLTCRHLNHRAAEKYAEHGVEPGIVALAALVSAHDLATDISGDPHDAIEWMRGAVNSIEQRYLDEARRMAN